MPKSTLRRIIDEWPGTGGAAGTSGLAPGTASGGVIHAAGVLFTAYRTIIASNVQRAIERLEDQKLNLSGGSMSGRLFLAGDPDDDDEAATKRYVGTYMAGTNEGTAALRVDDLAGVPLFHVVRETESGRIGVPTAAGITWTPAGVRIAPAILNYAAHEAATSTHTLADVPIVYCDGTFTVNMPPAASADGRVYHVVNVGTGTITINGTINGAAGLVLSTQWAVATLHSNGWGWVRL